MAACSPSAMSSPIGGYSHGASPLSRVVLKRPHESLTDQYFIDCNWTKEKWLSRPEFNEIADDHYRLMKKLQQHGVQVRCQGAEWVVSMNSMMVRDTCIVTPDGRTIECQLKMENRFGDSEECANYLDQIGLSPLGGVSPDATARGSDFVFVTSELIVCAYTSQTDEKGVNEVLEIVKKENPNINVIRADLRSGYGSACARGFDKMSDRLCCALSPIQENVVVACPDIVGAACCKQLEEQEVRVVTVTLEEWNAGGADVVAISPTKCVMRRLTKPGLGEEEDDLPESEPTYNLKRTLKQELGVRVYSIHMNSLHLSGCGINPFVQPYKRD